MAALTAGRQVRSMPPTCRDDSAGQKGNIIIYAGGMVLLDSTGYATNVNAATKYSPGVALTYRDLDRYDATATGPGGIALADNVNIVRWNEGIFGLDNDTGSPILATTQPGVILFWVDDHTVSLSSSNGSRAVVGRLHHLDGDLQVYVSMSKVIGRQAMEEIYGSSLGETIGPGAITLTGLTSLTPAAQTTGSPAYLTVTRALDTTLVLSVESPTVLIDNTNSVQFATGALTNQRAVRIIAPTYAFVGASTITNAATFAIGGAPVAGTNATITNSYALWVQAGQTELDGALKATGATNVLAPAVSTSGVPVALTVTGAADTTQTLSTEKNLVNINGARTVQWATGALTTQREVLIQAPTYSFVGASTITNAATLAISGAPVAGTNATHTNNMALWVQAGAVNLGQGAVTQITSISTGVTINTASGVITTVAASTAAFTAETGFTVTCAACLAGSSVIARVVSYAGTFHTNGIPDVQVTSISAGSFVIRLVNVDSTNALNALVKIAYVIT